jgi:hypothetical protein
VVGTLDENSEYTVRIGLTVDRRITGKWVCRPFLSAVFKLTRKSMSVTGSFPDTVSGCGAYRVGGYYDPPRIMLNLSKTDPPAGCADEYRRYGSVTNCEQMEVDYGAGVSTWLKE